MKNLIIVESPAKAKTIKNFLDSDYEVIASKGHIRDLPKSSFGIKIDGENFIPDYRIDKDHKEIVEKITTMAKKAKTTYIATDEDREGEAIGFHITQAIGKDVQTFPRIVFHEITKTAIKNALKSPRNIDMDKVNAQQARRLLDRIVGFKLSGLISSKINRGLSAGRVQSAALKIIVDKEREIRAFVPVDYYTIDAIFEGAIQAELSVYKGEKVKKQGITNEQLAQDMLKTLKNSSFIVGEILKKPKKSPTLPPFMTSTLQQSSSSLLGYSPSRTMGIAQKLYEGVETDNGVMGVITYMRTDSLNIAKEAQDSAREKISNDFGEKYLPPKPKNYVTKNKSAQEAHEAIRPTNIFFTPQIAKSYLKPDELKVYTLIYNRFLASQMEDAVFESQSITFVCDKGEFKASGRKLIFDGYYKLLGNDDKDKLLPDLLPGSNIKLENIQSNKHTTEPPARYSEASLIKTLESLGIGRPSTYAPTVSLLQNREYIVVEKKQILPQESAFKVTEMLEAHFNEIVDSKFSASMEDKLDDIAQHKEDWQKVLMDFYGPFMEKISDGKLNIASQKVIIPTGEFCPKCGKELVKRIGRYGEFIACSGYPKCKYIKPQEPLEADIGETSEVCEKCGKPMVKKRGRNGEFMACSGYPECKNTKSLKNPSSKPQSLVEVKCPECGGEILLRNSRRGSFYGCSNYPKCNFISNYKPINEKCPKCGYIMSDRTYRGKHIHECIKCKHRIEVEAEQ
ncbi:DNA topoisomerase I [Helicobacter sp. 12S02232-10]|uniref:type I DNA topoisomerase n=1 Tax=Helicobacter sp. 12S02232-10 TaxID=1476197 RepID=UPI000BA7A4F6|nr:type I DNA topoisomerase [Helicobacter sp. 12S02232-10]PAF49958.1 DNA topoisomerase I [Helicobacter sp. 12S02232-10]